MKRQFSFVASCNTRFLSVYEKISPAETSGRTSSKLVRLRFGYPVTLRSADFYGPQKSKEELIIREESFVNDSIRSAHQSRRSSIIPAYEAMDDPHLRRFFQSPVVLDIVRKALNLEYSPTKGNGTRPKNSTIKKRSKLVISLCVCEALHSHHFSSRFN
jgi:hypothetical protein